MTIYAVPHLLQNVTFTFFLFYSDDIMRSSWDLLLAPLYFEPKVAKPKDQSEFWGKKWKTN